MTIANFSDLLQAARQGAPRTVAVAAAAERGALQAAQAAQKEGLARLILVGDRVRIEPLARELGLDLGTLTLIDEPDSRQAARRAMQLVREGQAQVVMQGQIAPTDLLRAATDKEAGLRCSRSLSHVAALQIPGFDRLIFVADAWVQPAPDLALKADIVQNAIEVAGKLGVEKPRVAILAHSETVNPKVVTTVDAACLSKMAERNQIRGGIVDGPLAVDNAVSAESAAVKGIVSPIAGAADILIAPEIEAASMVVKAVTYFAHAPMAGVVAGAQAPLLVAGRTDTAESRLLSIALGVVVAAK